MNPTFVKKHTVGAAAGLSWEAEEIKALDSYLAEELVKLSPEDYEIVSEDESTPETPVEKKPEASTEENSEAEVEAAPEKAKRVYKKKTPETPSAE